MGKFKTHEEMVRAGGKARAKKLTKARRSEIARMGALAKAANAKLAKNNPDSI